MNEEEIYPSFTVVFKPNGIEASITDFSAINYVKIDKGIRAVVKERQRLIAASLKEQRQNKVKEGD